MKSLRWCSLFYRVLQSNESGIICIGLFFLIPYDTANAGQRGHVTEMHETYILEPGHFRTQSGLTEVNEHLEG